MILRELEPLEVFELGGVNYECVEVYPGGRIALCYELDENGEYIATPESIYPFKYRLISDIRFNRQHDLT